jgi:hypothetical protein
VRFKQSKRLLNRLVECSRHVLTVLVPSDGELCLLPESTQPTKGSGVLDVNLSTLSKRAAHQSRGSGHKVFDRQDVERTSLVVQHVCAAKRVPERSEQVHPHSVWFVDQLEEGFTFSSIWVDMIQEKRRRDRRGNRLEPVHDEIDVAEPLPFSRTPVSPQLRRDGQAARKGAPQVVRDHRGGDFARPSRVLLVQQCRKHGAFYRPLVERGEPGLVCSAKRRSVDLTRDWLSL